MDFLRLIRLGGTDAAVVYIALVAACMVFLVNASFNWGQAEDFLMIDWYRRVVLTGEWGAIDILSVKNGPHPLAFQVALVVGFYSLAGPGFTSVVVLSGVIVAATALAAYVTVADDLPTRGQKLLALCALVVLFFHPAQTNHLLWAFEVGWFAIPLFLVLALLALQRAKGVGPYLAVLFCLLASFSSGHGAFTWLAVAVLLALQRRLLWAWVFVVGFLAFSAASFSGSTRARIALPMRSGTRLLFCRSWVCT